MEHHPARAGERVEPWPVADRVAQVKAAGILVAGWTPNSAAELRLRCRAGVPWAITDAVARAPATTC